MTTACPWDHTDERAVSYLRALAADAVQKVGNGHPGTAMSLAPVAYLLFTKVMVFDPTDPRWLGRDRFVLSAGHSSLTLYMQLFLADMGVTLDDLRAFRTWGSTTPGHPEFGHTPGSKTHLYVYVCPIPCVVLSFVLRKRSRTEAMRAFIEGRP